MKLRIICTGFIMLFFAAVHSFAAHPLVTDDAGTVGAGKVQIEVTGELTHDKVRVFSEHTGGHITEKTRGGSVGATVTAGVHDRADVVLGIPYQWFFVREDGERTGRADGLSDISLDLKWRFFEQDGWSLAAKPGVSLPTGDDDRGLGNGRATYRMFVIGTKELAPWAFHVNLGYIRNENKAEDRKNLWHASAAAEVEVVKDLKAVANVGVERNAEATSSTNPAFALGGLIYQISEQFSIDGGVKFGLTKPSSDTTYLLGMTIKF
ncbi:MAG TPA: transporter [Dissulfurispiraceae bacterium]|nr:transporter [Dissulfurispiraceae bacterium]